jgi:hypothetical protein
VLGLPDAAQPGQGLVHPPEAQIGAEQGEADRRLAQQRCQ